MKKLFFILFIGINLYAGIYTVKLQQCLVNNTTPQDLKLLKTWIFFAFAQDKDLKNYVNISKSAQNYINKQMGAYVTNLLGDKCSKELKAAVDHDGNQAIENSFAYLGNVAGETIVTSPQVQTFIKKYIKYVDLNKIVKALK